MASNYGEAPPPYSPFERMVSHGNQTPQAQIEIKISCRKLLDMDTFSKSDPICVVYLQSKNRKEWREIGRTECIMNTLNPDFVKSFILDYFFEEQQMLKFEVYDIDSKSTDLSKHDFIGEMITSLGSIVGEHNGRVRKSLKNTKTRKFPGYIIVTTEEVATCRDFVTLQFCGKQLDKKDLFGKSDPYLQFERCNENGTFSVVHKTEVIKKTLNPTWKSFDITARTLCNGDYDRTIRIACYDWDRDGGHDLIGTFDTTLQDLVDYRNGRPTSYELIHPKKQAKKKKYKCSGVIEILRCDVEKKFSFLDYIRGGTELAFVVAIDFTASNGHPSNPQSLHYMESSKPNQYVQALQALGCILEDYDSDKMFPAFGFGAKVPPSFNVTHQFPLNFNQRDPNCHGSDGIIAAYHNSLNNVKLHGPTNFAPIIRHTSELAEEQAGEPGSQYFVLLMITDGIISDLEKTKEAIVEAATLPMSIIIVGVGSADFDAMEVLDGDDVRVTSRGRPAERDIVQFVPFNDYLNKNNMYDVSSGDRLAKNVLQELPGQLLEYMEKRGIRPAPPIIRDNQSLSNYSVSSSVGHYNGCGQSFSSAVGHHNSHGQNVSSGVDYRNNLISF